MLILPQLFTKGRSLGADGGGAGTKMVAAPAGRTSGTSAPRAGPPSSHSRGETSPPPCSPRLPESGPQNVAWALLEVCQMIGGTA